MPISSTEILERQSERGKTCLVFHHVLANGKVLGPFVEFRPTGEDSTAFLNSRASAMAIALVENEIAAAIVWCLAGNSITTFVRVETTLQQLARRVLRYMAVLENPRPAKNYAQRVVAAGQAQIKSLLGVSDVAAAGVVQWAQGVIDALNGEDAAKANANTALAEIGE